MAHHGIQLAIKHDGQIVKDFQNPHQRRHEDFKGFFRSRLISAPPNEPFEVIITFNERFKSFSEDGVLITIACEDYTQSFWIDYSSIEIIGKHTFFTFTTWDSPRSTVTQNQVQMQIPQPAPHASARADWMNADIYCANHGCVSVFIERGKLDDSRDDLETYVWGVTDPPKSMRNLGSRSSQVVRSEWFHWLRSENGYPYRFEFRNMDLRDYEPAVPEPDDEMDYDSETPTSDSEDTSSDTDVSNDEVFTDDDSNNYESDDAIESSPNRSKRKRNADVPGTHTRAKRRRLGAPAASTIVKLKVGRRALRKVCRRQDRGRDESYSTPKQEPLDEEPAGRNPASVKQEPTPDPSIRMPSYQQTARPCNIERPSSSGSQLRRHQVIDLTYDGANSSGNIQASPTPNQDSSVAAVGLRVSQDGSEEDIEDLEDQLEEVKIRRAIRAAKKKKAVRSKTA